METGLPQQESGHKSPDMSDILHLQSDSEDEETPKRKRQKRVVDNRKGWTVEEEQEITKFHNIGDKYPTANDARLILKKTHLLTLKSRSVSALKNKLIRMWNNLNKKE
jgi:hypothetical protein